MTIPTPFREAFSDGDDDDPWTGEGRDATYWEAVLDLAPDRIEAGRCIHPACTLTVSRPGTLTCGEHDCKLWLGWMPDTARAYLYETAAAVRAMQERDRGAGWRKRLDLLTAGVLGGAVVVAAFAGGVWLNLLHITA